MRGKSLWIALVVLTLGLPVGMILYRPERHPRTLPYVVGFAVGVPVLLVLALVWRAFKGPLAALLGGGARRILRDGRAAEATVLGIGETSRGTITVNDQPYLALALEIPDESGAPYRVRTEAIVPRTMVPRVQPGAKIPVSVDRADGAKVAIDWGRLSGLPAGPAAPADGMPTVGNVDAWSAEDDRLLAREGLPAKAKVLAVEPTGRSKGFDPIVRMSYEVTVKGRDPYRFEKDVPIPGLYADRLRLCVGQTFNARVHPHDPTKIKVDIRF